ncbi:glycoside hydrolase superfamily [Crepidotus variabilis]|uniref:Glycoside hydrolase superfamily n=1 Tax=Crepidotus variabilis TaxID=179855 RepID=A0A9P6JL74_9AGAR|nr:glycoside hydrolase superfamily [Crepidotus variabilis]
MISLSIALGFLTHLTTIYASPAADASLSINASGGKQSIFESAIFLEANINRGDDGGLYAELIYNRAFQENGGTTTGWAGIGNTSLVIDTTNPLSWAIPRSVVPSVPAGSTSAVGLYNTGWFNQLPVTADSIYTASFWARVASGTYPSGANITVGLYSADLATAYATATLDASKLTTGWNEFTVQLKPSKSALTANNVFAIKLPSAASGTAPRVSLTLISLFPPTFNNVKNGLRIDLAQALADLKPRYIRWPGGNDLEGNTIARRFNWTATIGPLRYRPGRQGTWNGYATGGLGLMEVFDWAESIQCKPLLGIYAGYSLDGTSIANTSALDPYIQDVLNEIHFMVDAPGSSTWAKLRASYGRTAPYDLDTIEVGNEDNLGNGPKTYGYRFARFTQAITKEFPSHMFQFIATDSKTVQNAPSVDIHDYVVADTFINYYNRYDSWPRNNTKIYALEYAVLTGDYINPNSTGLWDPGETENRWSLPELRGSVAEFVYHMGFERNGDLVKGAAYAPIFHNTPLPRDELWLPDLISFSSLFYDYKI